ncbi:hypothetical protein NUW58_g8338 [Xylaria curta]|uniref:Uncharacterized protein n=1 Tax=Xylaria curta TaxID=42375 RepID=A0ACC1N911_9PEZI|nr:hypothetical protein NUW58_g8338 [Xylaria curta]
MAGRPSPVRARRRETPPSNLDPMTAEDMDAMINLDSTLEIEPDEPDDRDDPPVRPGENLTTIGFEFELLVAVCRARERYPDPHPNDPRWQSEVLIRAPRDDMKYKYTVRNKIIDELNAKGLFAQKTPEAWSTYDGRDDDFEWWDCLEYENPNQNDNAVMAWVGTYQWDQAITEDENVENAVKALGQQFIAHHANNGLELHMTRYDIVKSASDTIPFMVEGTSPSSGRNRIKDLWYENMSLFIGKSKRDHYSASGTNPDPDTPYLPELEKQYTAWSCTDDVTVTGDMPIDADYTIPLGSVPTRPGTDSTWADPPDLYKWFGAEVISNVMNYDNPKTPITLRKASQAIRDAFRVHKPIVQVLSGVHIHIGQSGGWTLLQLKKFATLWHLLEGSMYKLHRKDRKSNFWCAPMATGCFLARHAFEGGYNSYIARTTGQKKRTYESLMMEYLPAINRARLREFFYNVWQYGSIDELNEGMGTGTFGTCSIRWRIAGEKLSHPLGYRNYIQTLEFRMMHGTLDADHVWKWASICERLVVFCRDSTPEVFKNTIEQLLGGNFPNSIGFNDDDLNWFQARRTDDEYFAYPDPNGRVNWIDPFMAPGYGEVHAV